MSNFYKSRFCAEAVSPRFLPAVFSIIAALISALPLAALAPQTDTQHRHGVTIQGNVFNSAGKSVGDASV